MFQTATFLTEKLSEIKISIATILKQVLLYSLNFFRRVTFSKNLDFKASNISHYLLFLESYLSKAATFSKEVTF